MCYCFTTTCILTVLCFKFGCSLNFLNNYLLLLSCVHEYMDVYSEVVQPDAAELINSPFGGRYCGAIPPRRRVSLYRAVALAFYTDKNASSSDLFEGRYAFINDCKWIQTCLLQFQVVFKLAIDSVNWSWVMTYEMTANWARSASASLSHKIFTAWKQLNIFCQLRKKTPILFCFSRIRSWHSDSRQPVQLFNKRRRKTFRSNTIPHVPWCISQSTQL